MTERTVSLDEGAYERLVDKKRDDESFSDVVRRLTGERSWSEVAGIWSEDADELDAAIEDGRDRSRDRRADAVPENGPLFSDPAVTVADPVDEKDVDDTVYDPDA